MRPRSDVEREHRAQEYVFADAALSLAACLCLYWAATRLGQFAWVADEWKLRIMRTANAVVLLLLFALLVATLVAFARRRYSLLGVRLRDIAFAFLGLTLGAGVLDGIFSAVEADGQRESSTVQDTTRAVRAEAAKFLEAERTFVASILADPQVPQQDRDSIQAWSNRVDKAFQKGEAYTSAPGKPPVPPFPRVSESTKTLIAEKYLQRSASGSPPDVAMLIFPPVLALKLLGINGGGRETVQETVRIASAVQAGSTPDSLDVRVALEEVFKKSGRDGVLAWREAIRAEARARGLSSEYSASIVRSVDQFLAQVGGNGRYADVAKEICEGRFSALVLESIPTAAAYRIVLDSVQVRCPVAVDSVRAFGDRTKFNQ